MESLRLDKWLWTARFFKTRSLASEAISGGKVHLNGQRTKPGKEVKIGSRIVISKGSTQWEVIVANIIGQRRPAKEAVLLYQETPESIAKRETEAAHRQQQKDSQVRSEKRPTKKQRRQIHKFKRD